MDQGQSFPIFATIATGSLALSLSLLSVSPWPADFGFPTRNEITRQSAKTLIQHIARTGYADEHFERQSLNIFASGLRERERERELIMREERVNSFIIK